MVRFTKEMITPAVTRIRGVGDVCMYLVAGSCRAALIDTGFGVGDLRGFIESLTDLPCDVLVTHGHLDHSAGAGQFERVYLNKADWDLSRQHNDVEFRKKALMSMPSGSMETLTDEDFIDSVDNEYLPLEDGDRFDLGGMTLEAIHVPGHTQGTMVILIEEERLVMFGDACGVGVLVCLPESSTVSEYRQSLLKLQKQEKRYDRVLREHGTCESPCYVLEDCIRACELVMNGEDDAVPSMMMGTTCFRAHAVDPKTGVRTDGREGNILYTKDRII